MLSYDPMAGEVKDDQERFFAPLRARCPVHHHVLAGVDADRINANPLTARPTNEFWSVFRWADCVEILQNPDRFPSKDGPGPERLVPPGGEGMLIWADEPAHIRQRRIAVKAFTPRAVDRQRPWIEATAHELIDAFGGRGRADVMAEFSIPLTIRTMAHFVGVGEDRVDDFWRWGSGIMAAFGGDTDAATGGFAAIQELFAYLGQLIGARRAALTAGDEPPEDVLTALITADYTGSGFRDDEIMMACLQLVVAGFETTSTALTSGVHLLCTHPAERAKLAADPELIGNAVEEVIRYATPLEGLFRTAAADTEIAGVPIPADAKVRVMFCSANRDERQFTDAEVFRIDRDPAELNRHIGFGHGIHTCLGRRLAQAELIVGLRALFARLPGLGLDPEEPAERNRILTSNGFRRLPVRWAPTAHEHRTEEEPWVGTESRCRA